ncbi:MAG: YaiI/YqxD family protein [Acetobacter sp.]|nr:YaiI/YqxD family protein [Bacteroides sp.]MCM1341576.1 YaiI/YqxD family protein [Acetobacter sp.]MCM1433653.1 YaiI/YqxD family protein [Clostridiales bacterium]
MRILIDADGCPVTKNAIQIADEFNIAIILFCDTSHNFNYENAEIITVSKGSDSADFALVNSIISGDIVITQDYGLSAMALAKNAQIINQNGLIISNKNIDTLLNTRHLSKKARISGKHLKGPAKRTAEQNKNFETVLRRILNENINNTDSSNTMENSAKY